MIISTSAAFRFDWARAGKAVFKPGPVGRSLGKPTEPSRRTMTHGVRMPVPPYEHWGCGFLLGPFDSFPPLLPLKSLESELDADFTNMILLDWTLCPPPLGVA